MLDVVPHDRPLSTRSCLVLNADYRPISTWPLSRMTVQEAAVALYKERVHLVEDWGTPFRTPSGTFPAPKVVAVRDYVNVHASPKFCRVSIYLRDRYRCQYCGERFVASELTYDHVFPKSRGGQTTWENVLTCCVDCNTRKRDQLITPGARRGTREGAWRPLKDPRQPTHFELMKNGLEFLDPALLSDFRSWLYWHVELEP